MRKKPRWGHVRPLLSVLAVIVGLVLVGPISPASAGGNPPGNNGTVKVDDDDFGGPNGHGNGGTDNGVDAAPARSRVEYGLARYWRDVSTAGSGHRRVRPEPSVDGTDSSSGSSPAAARMRATFAASGCSKTSARSASVNTSSTWTTAP